MNYQTNDFISNLKMIWGDDDPNIFNSIKNILEKEGLEVITSDKPSEIINLVKHYDPDFLCLDLNWSHYPNTDYKGFEIAADIRNLNNKLPVITFTAKNHEPEYIKKIIEFNFDAVFGKNEIDPINFANRSKELAIIGRIRKGEISNPFKIPIQIYEKFSTKIKRELIKFINIEYKFWIEEKLKGNHWIVVCNKKVVLQGNSFLIPEEKQTLEKKRKMIEHDLGYPTFYFLKPTDIESISISWRQIKDDDYYPVLPLIVRDGDSQFIVKGDFDTGAARTHISDDIVSIDDCIDLQYNYFKDDFIYCEKEIDIALEGFDGDKDCYTSMNICVVLEWIKSGFIKGHSDRSILVGRDILKYFSDYIFSLNWKTRTTKIKIGRPDEF